MSTTEEVFKTVEKAINDGKNVEVTIKINQPQSATESRQSVKVVKSVTIPPPPPPPRYPSRYTPDCLDKEDNPFMPKRPAIVVRDEGGCMLWIVGALGTISTLIYFI